MKDSDRSYGLTVQRRSQVLVAIFALVLGWGQSAATASDLEEVVARGTLRVVGFPDPLNDFVRLTDDGGFDGLDIKLLEAFATSLGVQLEVQPIEPFADILPALLRGEGDVVAGSITITDERAAIVDFTDPYFPVLVSVIVRRDGPPISEVGDLAGLAASAVSGTSHEQRLKGLGGVRLEYVPTTEDMYTTVTEGRAEFTIDDATTALAILPSYPDLKRALELPDVDHFGFAVTPGSDLRPALNDFLATAAHGESYQRLVLRYLGPAGVEALKLARETD